MLTLLLTALTFAAEPQLPAVEKAVPPVYPSAALAQGEGAVVTLQLDLDAQGRVVNVAVIGSAGPDFDAAAKDALRAYTFRPAYDTEGVAVAARIQYALRFEAAKAAPLSVEGTLLEGGTRQPLAEVELRILGPGGEQRSTRSDAEGRFRFAGLPEGAWTITASGPGLETETAELQVREGSVASARLYVARTRTWERTDEELVVEAEARGSEVTERVLNPEEVRYLPGTQGDLVRVVQNLPGVARPPLNIGQLIIRGTAPEDSSTFLDGARIPIVFHFSGFSTVLAADLIEEVAYLPGNWSVRYGRSLGGVVDLRTEEDLPERSTGYASVDLIQTQVFVDQRISEDAAITFAARRSYVDAILNPIFSKIPGVSVRAPRYWDVQLRARDELEDGQRLDLLYVGSDDRFEFVGESEEGSGVQVGLSTFFHKGRLRWTAPLPADWEHELTLSGGPEEQNFQFAVDGLAYEKAIVMGMREELMRPASPERWGWRAGLDAEWAWEAYLYDVEGFGSSEQGDGFRANPAFYVEPTAIYGRWTLIPGLRVESQHYLDIADTLAIDPRLAARYTATDSLIFKAATGQHSRFPSLRQLSPEADGNPDLGPQHAWQSSAGLEWQVTAPFSVDLSGFYNQLYDLVVGREDRLRFFTGPPPIGPFDTDPYANDGVGRVYGVESLVKWQDERTIAWLSTTLSRSLRTDRPGEEEALFAYDQPIVLNAVATHELPRRWRVGSRLRFSSGNPYTPVENRFQDLDSRDFAPVYGERDSGRLPPFWALDVRVDKEWVFQKWLLTGYLDIQNAANTKNVEVMAWTYDYSAEDPIAGTPIFPSIGLRGEW